jgi:hypothetical protein
MKRKIEPAVQTLQFTTSNTSAGATSQHYVDLSQVASIVNRRFYRQGLNWAVGGIKVLTSVDGSLTVSKLPNTWVMSNAWHKSFAAWQRMNNEALEETESVKPRFLDFKIYADSRHHNLGYGANLLPYSVSTPPAGGPDTANIASPPAATAWSASKFLIPDTTQGATGDVRERELIAVGASYPGAGQSGFQAVSLIEGYAASRGLPNVLDPNAPGDAFDATGAQPENWLTATFNEGTQQDADVIADMVTENNMAPYPFENDGVNVDTMYPGGANQLDGLEVHDFSFITPTTVGGTTRIRGGNFPCGLMKFSWTPGDLAGNIAIQVELVPGPHRGYLAMPMQEM